jgi:serine kinase of HPr protein (carbohydrate metabolism regulator)
MNHRQASAMQGIADSHIFFALATKYFFDSAECLAQAEYAKTLKKPFFIALQKGVEIPDHFLEGVENHYTWIWETQEELQTVVKHLKIFMMQLEENGTLLQQTM